MTSKISLRLKSLKKILKEQALTLLETIPNETLQDIDRNYRAFYLPTLKVKYRIIATSLSLYMLAGVVTAFFRKKYLLGSIYLTCVISFLIALTLVCKIKELKFQKTVFFLILIGSLIALLTFLVENSFGEKVGTYGPKRTYLKLNSFITYLILIAILSINEPISQTIICFGLSAVFFSGPIIFITDGISAAQFLLLFLSVLFVYLVYLNKRMELELFDKYRTDNSNERELARILQAVSTSPLYLINLPDFKAMTFMLLKSDYLEDPLGFVNNLIKAADTQVFECGSDIKTDTKGEDLLKTLHEIDFTAGSSFSVFKVNMGDLNEYSPRNSSDIEMKLQNFSQVSKDVFLGESMEYGLIELVFKLMETGDNFNGYKFIFRDLSSRTSNMMGQGKTYYDIEISFISDDYRVSGAVVIQNTSSRTIASQLETQNKEMDMKLSTITHDMRAPLHAIMGFTENLLYKCNKLSSVGAESTLNHITANCEHLSLLVADILDSTRIANNRFTLNQTKFDLVELARKCIELSKLINDRPLVEYQVLAPPQIQIENDQQRVKTLFLTLLLFASKHTHHGSISVNFEEDENEETIICRLTDTGKGFEQDALKSLLKTAIINKERDSSKTPRKSSIVSDPESKFSMGLSRSVILSNWLGPAKSLVVKSVVGVGTTFDFKLYSGINQDKKLPKNTNRNKKNISKIEVCETGRSSLGSFHLEDPTSSRTQSENQTKKFKLKDQTEDEGNTFENMKQAFEDIKVPASLEKKPLHRKTSNEKISFMKPIFSNNSQSSLTPSSNANFNILIIEDNLFSREVLINYIERYFENYPISAHFQVDSAESYSEVVEMIDLSLKAKVNYSLVISDFNLEEGKTALDVIKYIKTTFVQNKILFPTFFLVSGQEVKDQIKKNFFKCFLKPYSFEEFSKEVNRWFRFAYSQEIKE